MATLLSTTCNIYKPRTELTSYFYHDTTGILVQLAFNKEWAKKNLSFDTPEEDQAVDAFLNGEIGYFNWLDIVSNAPELTRDIWDYLENEKAGPFKMTYLRKQALAIITDFFKKAYQDGTIRKFTPISNTDYANVAKADKIILQNLTTGFIGVENIAKEVNLSPTKLKQIFKSVFGFSMLQYHKEKNMLLAMQLIQKSEIQIKNIALITGFESSSKFTAAFKKRFGILPSEVRLAV